MALSPAKASGEIRPLVVRIKTNAMIVPSPSLLPRSHVRRRLTADARRFVDINARLTCSRVGNLRVQPHPPAPDSRKATTILCCCPSAELPSAYPLYHACLKSLSICECVIPTRRNHGRFCATTARFKSSSWLFFFKQKSVTQISNINSLLY